MTEPLQEAFFETERARLQRWLPWVHLFRAFRLATRWQNLLLALLGVLLLAAARWGCSHLPYASHPRGKESIAYRTIGPWTADPLVGRRTLWPCEQEFLSPPLPTTRDVLDGIWAIHPLTLLAPLGDLVRPATALFQRRSSWSQTAEAWLHVLLVLSIGSLIGGAITRRVALEFGRSIEPSLRESLRFSASDFSFYIGAPLISVVGVGLLLALGRAIAWLGRIPGIGEAVAATLWGLLLLFSLVLALILMGVAAAWPLMIAAHSCEGTDSFDALNRAYNYVFVRPWYAGWLLLVTLAYGSAVLAFVLWLTGLTVHLSAWIAAGPLSDAALGRITLTAPPLVESATAPPGTTATLAGQIGGLWQHGLASLLTAFVYSFFWTSATLIYLLLRRSVDACDLQRIYVPQPPAPPGPPLAGIAAVERREQAAPGLSEPPADQQPT